MEPVTARCSQCGYKEVKEFDLVGVALRNAAKAWAAEVGIRHNSRPNMDHQMVVDVSGD